MINNFCLNPTASTGGLSFPLPFSELSVIPVVKV